MAALASILLLLAVAAARAAPPTTAANRLAARRDAGRLLGRVLLPAGARPLASPPPALRSPFQRAGTPAVVDERALWQAPQPLAQVLAFERAHRPRGSRLVLEGTGTDASGRSISGLGFAWPALPGRLSSRILLVAATSRPDGSTALRVDAQVVWVVARSPREAVPAGARQVDLREGRRPPVRFTAPAEVARIVRWLDELPVVQPGGYACPDLVSGPVIVLDVRGGGGALLARARFALYGPGRSLVSTQCNPLGFAIRGRRERPLVGGRFLLRLERLLGRSRR